MVTKWAKGYHVAENWLNSQGDIKPRAWCLLDVQLCTDSFSPVLQENWSKDSIMWWDSLQENIPAILPRFSWRVGCASTCLQVPTIAPKYLWSGRQQPMYRYGQSCFRHWLLFIPQSGFQSYTHEQRKDSAHSRSIVIAVKWNSGWLHGARKWGVEAVIAILI